MYSVHVQVRLRGKITPPLVDHRTGLLYILGHCCNNMLEKNIFNQYFLVIVATTRTVQESIENILLVTYARTHHKKCQFEWKSLFLVTTATTPS